MNDRREASVPRLPVVRIFFSIVVSFLHLNAPSPTHLTPPGRRTHADNNTLIRTEICPRQNFCLPNRKVAIRLTKTIYYKTRMTPSRKPAIPENEDFLQSQRLKCAPTSWPAASRLHMSSSKHPVDWLSPSAVSKPSPGCARGFNTFAIRCAAADAAEIRRSLGTLSSSRLRKMTAASASGCRIVVLGNVYTGT